MTSPNGPERHPRLPPLLLCIITCLAAGAAPATRPTGPQQQWLDAVLAGKPGDPALKEPLTQLRASVREVGNEAIAARVAEAAREHPLHRAALLEVLDERVGTPAAPGPAGPYLKAYATLLLDVLEGKVPALPKDPPLRARWSVAAKGDVFRVYLIRHPDDKETRERLVALARPCAKVSDLPPVDRVPRGGRGWTITRCGLDIRTVWHVLVQGGALRDGMKLTDALPLLGEPTRERFSRGGETNHVYWAYRWNLRLAPPTISAELKDGKLSNFRVTR